MNSADEKRWNHAKRQPCRNCENYNEGKECHVGGEVKGWWTGCIVWKSKEPANQGID